MNSNFRILTCFVFCAAMLQSATLALAYYNPQTGKWLSRDPIDEKGFQVYQKGTVFSGAIPSNSSLPAGRWFVRDKQSNTTANPYSFVNNAAPNQIDVLGLVARGGFMQMNCRQPCQDFKRAQLAENGEFSDAGGIVCCGGVKFVCVWGADGESIETVKKIIERCIGRHERRHLKSVDCDQCSEKIYRPPFKSSSQGKAACEEEMNDHAETKSCFEQAMAECQGDQTCIDRLNSWITSEQRQYEYYKRQCGLLSK